MTDAPGGPAVLSAGDPRSVDLAAAALVAGSIVGLPTETVYGLAVLPTERALTALMDAKRRHPGKGIALLVDDLSQVRALVLVPAAGARLAERLWPGALTLVLPCRPGASLPAGLTGGRSTLAVRLPDHHVPRALAARLGPIAVSSANLSGEREATTADDLVRSLGAAVALVVDDGPVRGGVPSTVVAVSVGGEVTVLRRGAIGEREIESALRGRDRRHEYTGTVSPDHVETP